MKDSTIAEFDQRVKKFENTDTGRCKVIDQPWGVTLQRIRASGNEATRRIEAECRAKVYCSPCRIEDALPAPDYPPRELTNAEKALALRTGCVFQEEGFDKKYKSKDLGGSILIEEVNEVFGNFKQGYVHGEITDWLTVRNDIMNRTYAPAIPLEKIRIIK